MSATAMHIPEIDLENPENFVAGVPHHTFRRLRREAPVYRHPERHGAGFWCITKHEDVRTISKDPGRFISSQGTNIEQYEGQELANLQTIMLNMDPPRHSKYRRLVSAGFTPRIVTAMEEKIRLSSRRIVDAVASRGECDFVTDIAAELPLQVIADIMGIPQEDRRKVFDWSNRLIGFDDPEFQNSRQDGILAATEMYLYANQLAVERRDTPGDDLVRALMRAEVDGERLTEQDFDSFFLLLAVAGNETTRNLISGGMLALIENRDQWERLLANRALMTTAVEEMLRWVSPVMYFRRTATRDTEIRGQAIAAGDKVVMWYPSANRDEDVFRNPETFDVGRTPNDHLAFGIGEHFCLGSNLARLEIRCIFEELLNRLPDIDLAAPVQRLRSNFINGIKRMPVRFSAT